MVISVDCPSCATSFPVDTNKVPEGGVNARCSECAAIFRVERPVESVVEPVVPPMPAVATEVVPEPEVVEAEAEPEVVEAVPEPAAFEAEVAEAEPAPARSFEEGTREAVEEALEAEEPPPTYATEESDFEPAGAEAASAGGFGLADALEEVLEEEPEGAGPEEEADVSDWGALRELLEGVDDVGTDEPEAPRVEAPVTEAAPETGDVHLGGAVEESVVEEVVEEAHALVEETIEEAPQIAEAEVETPDASAAGTEVVWDVDREVEEAAEQAASATSPGWFTFGRQDPDDKARRLARVLVSDMVMYNPERHDRALNNGTLKEDFEEEIRKSWREYVEQVGEEMASGTTYWSDALNDLLAKGQQIF